MKKLSFFLIFSVLFTGLTAQAPDGFNYQAVATNASGSPIANKTIQVKISILSDTTGFRANGTGTYIWEEQQSVVTNLTGLFSLIVGNPAATRIQGSAATFSEINWKYGPLFIGIKIMPPSSAWKNMGTSMLMSVPYSKVTDGIAEGSMVKIVSNDDAKLDSALFEVKRKDGQTVFAVYPEAVNIYVPRSGKGVKGGFAVGGFDATKADPQDYFRVTPDSVRIYIDPNPAKGVKGGFAVGGYDESKGINDMYFNLTGATSVNTVAASPQVLWYPNKNAFLAGNVHIGHIDSVGSYSTALGYQSRAIGNYSQAFGYKATAFGNYSTSIGKRSVAGVYNLNHNAFALGNGALATGEDSYALGSGALATGRRSFAFGSVGLDGSGNPTSTPTQATADYASAFGMGAQAQAKGSMAFGVGSISSGTYSGSFGYYGTASGSYSTAIGYQANASGLYSTALGNSRAFGEKSTALGSYYSYTYLRRVFNRLTGTYIYLPTTINVANTATRGYSLAVGNGNNAEDGGIAIGSNNAALSSGAVALGHSNTADTTFAFAAGYRATSHGINAMAIGENVTAEAANSLVVGSYNQTSAAYNKYDWVESDPLFVVGNGDEDIGHDAFKITKNGSAYIFPENAPYGLYTAPSTTTYTGITYGVYSNNTNSNATNANPVYGGYFRSYNYGLGMTYGLRVYTFNQNASNTSNVYSGYFYGGSAAGGTYQGFFCDVRSGSSADVAEYIYDSNGNTEPADVVAADPLKKESVVKSMKPYQTGVLGVISTKPHMTMGMELVVDEATGEPIKDAKPAARLALTGRVPVKVTGENGAIVPGDYLTSSSTPGHAMKWSLVDVNSAKDFDDLKKILSENEKRRGAIIGKAVESFSGSGTGKIMVLISLQ